VVALEKKIDMMATVRDPCLYLQLKGEVMNKWKFPVLKLQVRKLIRNCLVRNYTYSCLVKICAKAWKNVSNKCYLACI